MRFPIDIAPLWRALVLSAPILLVLLAPAPGANLVHHWTFDEGSGGAVSDSVGVAEMNIVGSTSGWIAGKYGSAFQFTGSNYAETADKDLVANPGASGPVAVAGWFKTSSAASRVYLFQIETLYELRMNRGQLQVSFRGNSGNAPKWGEGLNDGLWHHFVAQNTGTVTQLYIDGTLIGSRSESPISLATESRKSAIAAKQNGNNPFPGAMDDVRYYLGTLTETEIRTLAGVASIPPRAVDDSYSEAADTPLVVPAPGVLGNDVEVDGDPVTAHLVTTPTAGTVALAADGSFLYTPPPGFSGAVTFTYLARDKDGDSAPATVTVTVLDPASSLTPAEVARIESDLGITLSQQEKLDLAAIVKPKIVDPWRTDAEARIEAHRRANLTVRVEDADGTPIPGATVRARLARNAFKFGGVVTVTDLTDAAGTLSGAGSTAADWQRITRALFNALGLENGLKPKTTNQHQYLPGFLSWASSNGLPVRGHLLLWPGGGDLEDLDNPSAVSGVDYGDHLSGASLSAYKSYNVLGAVDAYRASGRTQADKDTLAATVNAEIAEWAGRWDVYEWDVLNETLGNVLLQEILGYGQMAEWFKLAHANKQSPSCGLLINDYQIVSARFDAGSTAYQTRRDTYFSRIDQVLAGGGQLTGIGFQSRFKFLEGYSPATVYARIQEFAARYPSLDLAGTEFEIPDWYDYYSGDLVQAYDEVSRARWTEEILTTYFSHPNVTAINAWDYMNPTPDGTANAYSRSLCYYGDGPGGAPGPIVKLNGLVWHYLHRIRYATDVTGVSGADGRATLRGFKGDYELTVSFGGNEYPAAATLAEDGSSTVSLGDIDLEPPPAPIDITLERWAFDDAAGTQLKDAAKSTGTCAFSTATPHSTTDGNGSLRVNQDPTKSSGGAFLASLPITVGPRETGTYELDFTIAAASLTGGDASGASLGFGLRDPAANADIFRVRLNKTTGGLAISTFIDNVYTTIRSYPGIYALAAPVRVRSVVDLDADTAQVFLTEGPGPELPAIAVPLSASAEVWSQISFSASNNTADWGASDSVAIGELVIRRLGGDTFALWRARTDWGDATGQSEQDDPDGDGVPNFLEFAFGGNPTAADSGSILPEIREVAGQEVLAVQLGADSADVEYWIEHSTDLIDWTTIPPSRVHGTLGAQLEIPLPSGDAPRWFSRVRAQAPE